MAKKATAKATAKADGTEPLPADFSYEQSLARLDAIVRQLERAEAPLAESLRLFDEGQLLMRQCQQWLDTARLRVNEVIEHNGQLSERPID